MSAASNCRLIGHWRIVEADLWERGYLDLVEPAAIKIGANGHGKIAFGAMQAGLDLGYSQNLVHFTWAGFDEMDEVSGDGHVELLDDGTIEIVFAYHNGDEAVLKAEKETSSTAC
jgi:hypothetical protein